MNSIMDGWALANFVINLIFLFMLVPLVRRAPCWMQLVSVSLFTISMFVFCLAFIGLAFDFWLAPYLFKGAAGIEHLGVMVWIWRMHIQQVQRKEEAEWNSSAPYPSS